MKSGCTGQPTKFASAIAEAKSTRCTLNYKLHRLFVFLLNLIKCTNYSVCFLYHLFVRIVVIDVG